MGTDWLVTIEILAYLMAGLGLVFVGIRLITKNLRLLADQRLRLLLSRATSSGRSAAALGLFAGAVAQSIHALILVLISLVTAGALDARKAQPIINFANLGTSLLVLIAALNIKIMVLILVGITGVLYYFEQERSARTQQLVRALLGIGLLFLGISLIKDGSKPLVSLPFVVEMLSMSGQSLLIAFATGMVFAIIAHSASTITIVAMALAATGVIDLEYGLMIVYGAGLGTGLGTLLLTLDQRGIGRQLALYQLILKTLGLVLLLPLFWLEFYANVPLVAAGLAALPISVSLQIAFSYILYQIACDVAMHPLHHRVQHFLEHIAPPTQAEVLGQPRFIHPGAAKYPAGGLALAQREQLSLLERLPGVLDAIRNEAPATQIKRRELEAANTQVAQITEAFINEMLSDSLSGATLEQALMLKNRHQLLIGLQETTSTLTQELERVAGTPGAQTGVLVQNLAETLHMLLLTLVDSVRDLDPQDIALLQDLTGDRSKLMDQIRRRLIDSEELDSRSREALFAATSTFERAVWLIRRFALSLKPVEQEKPGAQGHSPAAIQD